MKRIIFMIVLLSSLVFAMFGGESEVIETFENCENLTVDVVGEQQIDSGEYWFEDCEGNTDENIWYCECLDNNFNLILSTQPNTVNTYNFTIMYVVETESDKDVSNIEVLNNDIIVKDISYSGDIIKLNLSGSGNKTIRINVSVNGCPRLVYMDDVSITFTCTGKVIEFDVSFSERIIKLDYSSAPVTTTSSGGSSSHNYENQDKIIKANKTEREEDIKDISLDVEDDILIGSGREDVIDSEEPEETEPIQDKSYVFVVVIVLVGLIGSGVALYFIY